MPLPLVNSLAARTCVMKTRLNPFVKWAGGKKQLLDKLYSRVPTQYGTYYEPFIGGGALFLALQPARAVISDINEQLLNAYLQLKNNAEAVIHQIESYDSTPCDKAYYLSMRDIFNHKIRHNELDLECAALMIWINKHCFNGLYRVNSKGFFNVSYNNKISGNSIEKHNLTAIGNYLQNHEISIQHSDFETACSKVKRGDFVYFDSPYVPVSPTAHFTDYTKGGFSLEDHKRLAKLFRKLDKRGAFVMLSNHNVPLVHELYRAYHVEIIEVRRNINRDGAKRIGQEVIIRNYESIS